MSDRFSVAEAALYLKTCAAVIYALAAARELPHYRIGLPGKRGRIIILRSDCDAFLEKRRVEAAPPQPRPPRRCRAAFHHLDL